MTKDAHPQPEDRQSSPPSSRNSAALGRLIEWGLVLFFWCAVALMTMGRAVLNPHLGQGPGLNEGEALYAVLEIVIWAFVTPFLFWVTARLSPDRIGWLRTIPLLIVLGILVSALVDLCDHLIWNSLVPNSPPRPISIGYVLDNFHFANEFFIYIAVIIAGFARTYFLRFQAHRKESILLRMDAARLQAHLAEARLQALRMQINPHFLFNTLHVISNQFEENPRAARRMIARLSDILRYTFEGSETREVTLENELAFLDGYLDIQRFRFEERLQVRFDISPEAREAMVPTLILQPLVENAIEHGISRMETQGMITLRAWRSHEALHIQVMDNGPGPPTGQNGLTSNTGGIGLRNTRERLATLFGDKQQFIAEPLPEGGFIASITIPYHTSNDYVLTAVED